jgi:hypothetical protein
MGARILSIGVGTQPNSNSQQETTPSTERAFHFDVNEPSRINVRVFAPDDPREEMTDMVGSRHRLKDGSILWISAEPLRPS